MCSNDNKGEDAVDQKGSCFYFETIIPSYLKNSQLSHNSYWASIISLSHCFYISVSNIGCFAAKFILYQPLFQLYITVMRRANTCIIEDGWIFVNYQMRTRHQDGQPLKTSTCRYSGYIGYKCGDMSYALGSILQNLKYNQMFGLLRTIYQFIQTLEAVWINWFFSPSNGSDLFVDR